MHEHALLVVIGWICMAGACANACCWLLLVGRLITSVLSSDHNSACMKNVCRGRGSVSPQAGDGGGMAGLLPG